jgi:hypothetical protein
MLAQAPRPPAARAAPPPSPVRQTPDRPEWPVGRATPPARSAPASRSKPPAGRGNTAGPGKAAGGRKDAEHEILFQKYFKSVNPQRTYASQVKKAGNGNHYVVFTEGRRDDATGEVRKTRLFVYSEDFVEFFRMLQETAHFVRDHPVPREVREKRNRLWARKDGAIKRPPGAAKASTPAPRPAPKPPATQSSKPPDPRQPASPPAVLAK